MDPRKRTGRKVHKPPHKPRAQTDINVQYVVRFMRMSLTCRCHRSRGTPGTFDHFDMPPRRCRTSVNPISRSFFTPSGDRTACSQMTTVGADGERPRSLSLFSNEARPGSTGQRFAPRKWCFRYSNAHRTSTICVSEAERTASMPSISSSCVRNPGSHQGVLRFGCRLPLLVGRDFENAISFCPLLDHFLFGCLLRSNHATRRLLSARERVLPPRDFRTAL